MSIWFSSDTHFRHKNIMKFCPNTRVGADSDEMTETLIRNWNRDVKHDDTVYILGDVFFCGATEARKILARLSGNIHLVYGNHDQVIRNNKDIRDMFASVQEYLEIKIDGKKVVLFHYPMLEWNGMHHGAYALFGHVHGSMDNHPEITSARIMDVGVDSRPMGVAPDNGAMSLWSWEQVDRILKDRPVRGHH